MLDQILADPADDALRLVYADQLLAAGDPRGEYITVEARLAETPRGAPERAELARRRGALRRQHGDRWWPRIPNRQLGTRCGFAETAAVFPSELGRLARIAAREPISALELIDYRGTPLPDAEWQRRIRRLVVNGVLNHYEVMPLLESPLCDVVEELVVWSWGVAAWPPFAGHLPRCRRLCLAGSRFERVDVPPEHRTPSWRADPLRALAGWDHAARLEELDLSHCSGTMDTVHSLVLLGLSALRVLRLSGSWIDDDCALELASHLSAFPALSRLELAGAGVSADCAEVLRSARTGAAIVLGSPAPSRIAIDAVGIDLELFQLGEGEWAVAIDGVRRPIVLEHSDGRELVEEPVDTADLGWIVRALATGARRQLYPDGMEVIAGRQRAAGLRIAPDRSVLRLRNHELA